MGVASYVLYHDKCATFTMCYATNLMDTQQWRGWYCGGSNSQHGEKIPTQPTPFIILLLKMFLFTQGKGQALDDPIKGGMNENILDWM
jgi:hypothetical protein